MARFLNVAIIFFVAWLIHRLSWRIASLIVHVDKLTRLPRLSSRFDRFVSREAMAKRWSNLHQWLPEELKLPRQLRQERQETLRELIASGLSLLAFVTATVVSLGQFVEEETVVWITGLFSSALAFAGRTSVGDFLAGLNIIFQDWFDVGDKILVKAQLEEISGVVEHVNLSSTWLRATSGELYIIQNGEMRFICNYRRGDTFVGQY